MAVQLPNKTYQVTANVTQSTHSLYGAIPNNNITLSLNGSSYSDLSIYNSATTATTLTQSGTIKLSGDSADIDINGVSLKSTLAGIQQRLALLEPNPALEKEWEELKRLGDEYRALEQEIKDRVKTWDILKKE